MDDDRFKRWNNSVTLVAAGFGLLASLLGGFNTWQTRALEARFKEAEEGRKQRLVPQRLRLPGLTGCPGTQPARLGSFRLSWRSISKCRIQRQWRCFGPAVT